jgi:hypothetical protein
MMDSTFGWSADALPNPNTLTRAAEAFANGTNKQHDPPTCTIRVTQSTRSEVIGEEFMDVWNEYSGDTNRIWLPVTKEVPVYTATGAGFRANGDTQQEAITKITEQIRSALGASVRITIL